MRNRLVQTIAGTFVGLLMLVGCSQLLVSGQDEIKTANNRRSLEGTWRTVVTPRNCQTGDPLGITFPGLLTFAKGGTLVGTSTAVSSAFGVWKREHGSREYSFATLSFRYNASGVLSGTRRIAQNVTLSESGDELTTNGSFQDTDVNGTIVMSGCSTATGTRFE